MSVLNLNLLNVYSAMARHAAESQKVSATNISHASEPGYQASEIESFQDFLQRAANTPDMESGAPRFQTDLLDAYSSPNGNSVNLEEEVFKAAQAQGDHELAVSVYTKSLDLLRTAIGKKY